MKVLKHADSDYFPNIRNYSMKINLRVKVVCKISTQKYRDMWVGTF